MNRIRLLDCTLRDGGYITNWVFGRDNILKIVNGLTDSGLDYVEIGYLNKDVDDQSKSLFQTIKKASEVLPQKRGNTIYLAMADVDQFLPENLEPYQAGYIDGIRVVFYKHQIEKAMTMCKAVAEAGYKLFVQPMVTVDYSKQEYADLIDRIKELNPYAVSIVDSFGYMNKTELLSYFQLLDMNLAKNVLVGFHSHNNMQMALLNAESLFTHKTDRNIIIDASLYGMGRGAGNLNTELILNYYNQNVEKRFKMNLIFELISEIVYPIYKEKKWGYSPYYFLTAMYKCHPNYASYLLSEYDVSIQEFEAYLKELPEEMRTKCRKPSVIEMYRNFKDNRK